jgi:hypothetical protein
MAQNTIFNLIISDQEYFLDLLHLSVLSAPDYLCQKFNVFWLFDLVNVPPDVGLDK